jgi:hypothetical protein
MTKLPRRITPERLAEFVAFMREQTADVDKRGPAFLARFYVDAEELVLPPHRRKTSIDVDALTEAFRPLLVRDSRSRPIRTTMLTHFAKQGNG